MPLKPILDIELDDSKFKEFTKLYDKYQAQIKKLPEQWAAVNLAVGDNAESIKEAKDSAKEQSEEIKNQTEHAKKFHTVVKATRDTFTSINARSKNIEDSIFRATKHLARWSTLTAVVSGLTGGAALFGINKLVDLVASQRRQSMGLGISYGQNLSFNTNYQRLINPGSMLSNIATGKYTIGSPEYIAMSALGINGSEIANKSASDLSAEFVQKVHDRFKNTEPGFIGPQAEAMGLTNIAPLSELITISRATDDEIKSMDDKYKKQAQEMGLGDKTQLSYQDLVTTLLRTKNVLTTVFADRLAPLAPKIAELSTVFSDAVVVFLKSDDVKKFIGNIAGDLGELSDEMKKPEFQTAIENFIKQVGQMATSIWNFVSSFGGKDTATPLPASQPSASPSGAKSVSPLIQNPISSITSGSVAFNGRVYPNTIAGRIQHARDYAASIGLPPDLEAGLATTEGANTFARGANFASTSDIDPITKQPFSFSTFQNNMRPGAFGDILRQQTGLDSANANDWQAVDEATMRWQRDHGYGPWTGDPTIEAWRNAGKLPIVTIRPNTGNNAAISHYITSNPYTSADTGH